MTASCVPHGPLILAHILALDREELRLGTTAAVVVRAEVNSHAPVHIATRDQHVAKIARLIATPDTLPPPRSRVHDRIPHSRVPVRIRNRPMRATDDLLKRRIPRKLFISRRDRPRRENSPPRRSCWLGQSYPVRLRNIKAEGESLLLVQVRSDRSRRVLVLPAPPRKNLM